MTTHAYPSLAFLIDGEWVSGGGRETRPVVDPARAETIAELPIATAADVDSATDAAARAFAPGVACRRSNAPACCLASRRSSTATKRGWPRS
jgi:acyl-CoA reductase-like NAD-dependent aldehyde dehydrogenase